MGGVPGLQEGHAAIVVVEATHAGRPRHNADASIAVNIVVVVLVLVDV